MDEEKSWTLDWIGRWLWIDDEGMSFERVVSKLGTVAIFTL